MDEPALVAVPVLMAPWPRLEAVYADDLGVLPHLLHEGLFAMGSDLVQAIVVGSQRANSGCHRRQEGAA